MRGGEERKENHRRSLRNPVRDNMIIIINNNSAIRFNRARKYFNNGSPFFFFLFCKSHDDGKDELKKKISVNTDALMSQRQGLINP